MTISSSQILSLWDEGIHYCGDIDDMIDAVYDENRAWYEFESVLEKHFPDIDDDLKDDILCDLMTKLCEMEND